MPDSNHERLPQSPQKSKPKRCPPTAMVITAYWADLDNAACPTAHGNRTGCSGIVACTGTLGLSCTAIRTGRINLGGGQWAVCGTYQTGDRTAWRGVATQPRAWPAPYSGRAAAGE